MDSFSYSHLSDRPLLDALSEVVARDRINTAELIALIAEVDTRRLFVGAGCTSMRLYCTEVLRLSDDSAAKRIQAARAARNFPVLFEMLADGRLHLSAVCLLAPHLSRSNASDLIAAATHKSKSEIEHLIAARFPQSEVLPLVTAIPACVVPRASQDAPGHVGTHEPPAEHPSPEQAEPLAKRPPPAPIAPATKQWPIAQDRYLWHFTVGKSANDKLRHAQELLGHQIPSGDPTVVLERALDALIVKLEKTKYAATDRPQTRRRPTNSMRYVPAAVRRAVRERNGDQCSYVSEDGRRCSARTRLEFDHILPVARGGDATADNLRLRCRVHNQFEAERAFGVEFMRSKRDAARVGRAQGRTRVKIEAVATKRAESPSPGSA